MYRAKQFISLNCRFSEVLWRTHEFVQRCKHIHTGVYACRSHALFLKSENLAHVLAGRCTRDVLFARERHSFRSWFPVTCSITMVLFDLLIRIVFSDWQQSVWQPVSLTDCCGSIRISQNVFFAPIGGDPDR